MSGHLWKYYFENDLDSFRHVLDPTTYTASRAQKAFAGWQGGDHGTPMNSSPASYKASSVTTSKGRRIPAPAPIPLTRRDINSRDAVGMTILHHAASSSSENALGFAEALLGHPWIDLYIQDAENGWTSLHRALYFGNIAIARLTMHRDSHDILGRGSSGFNQHARGLVKIKDREGYGPLDLYSLTIKDRTLHEEQSPSLDVESDDEAQGDSGDRDDEGHRQTITSHVVLGGDEVFTFGSNKNVTLGFGDEDDRQFPERISLRRPDHLLQRFYREHREARNRARFLAGAASQDVGNEQPKAIADLPVLVRNTPLVIQDVQMSKLHTAVLTTDPVANLHICGHGPGGRLGIGDETTRYQFTCVESGGLGQKKVAAVALGQNHTLAITDVGEVFSWGNNAFGQLGYSLPKPSVKDDDPISTYPRQIFGPLKRELICGISASRIHSVAHTSSSLYTFGKNEGQLGIVDSDARSLEMQITPRKVAASLFSSPIMSVSAIDGATICLLENREVWVFANYGYAKLSFPLAVFTNHFLKESWLATKYDTTPNKISKITAAGDTICALSTGGDVFTVTISRRPEAGLDNNTSTTNPKQIRGALSQPHRVWSAKSKQMVAHDVDVDQDGSIILATQAGNVWRRTRRATIKNATASGIGEYKPKDYKFVRVPTLTRVTAVRASGFGAYAAIRKDCDVTRTQIGVDESTLWKDVAPLLSFSELARYEEQSDDEDPTPRLWRASSTMQPLTLRCLRSDDLENELTEVLRSYPASPDDGYNMELGTTLSDVRIPIHEFILSGRSRAFRSFMSEFRSGEDDLLIPDLLHIRRKGTKIVVLLQGVDFLTAFNMVVYAYTDSVVDFWNHTRHFPVMAARYRTVRTELMKIALRLELVRLEAAVRQMVQPTRSMSMDFELALEDPSYFDSGDVVVDLADGEMTLHSAVMCQRCPFFDGFFRGRAGGRWLAGRRTDASSLIRVDLSNIETHLFEIVVRHIYADAGEEVFDDVTSEDLNDFLALEELFDHVMDVMSVANELMIDRLSQICQRLIGRYVSEFKDAALEYVCLSLEAVLQNGSLDELDDDLLLALDVVVRDNQLATLPFARSGRAEALLFDKYPELAERIERGKRAKIDAIVLSNKYAESDGIMGSVFRAQTLEELSTSPSQQRARRKASKDVTATESPAVTPLKSKASAPDLMFDMSDGDGDPQVSAREERPEGSKASRKLPSLTPVVSPGVADCGLSPQNATPATPVAPREPRLPGQPWGTVPLSASKLDLKDIMSQTTNDQPSNITLALRQQAKREGTVSSSHNKLSQKERKKLQAQGLGQAHKTEPAAPAVSPWQAMSERRKFSQPVVPQASPASSPRPQAPTIPSTPQLTMRQTVANGKAAAKQKKPQTPTKSAQERPSSASGPGMSVDTTPIPTPHSVRHIPLPSHSPSSLGYSMTIEEILSQQEAEKNYIKDAAAKRSLQEIQQEQEFQQWWDQESKRVMLEEEQKKRADERATKAARGGGRGRSRRGKGKEKKDGDGDG
ncbi:hypothetical protein M011DRAFT_371943, partial [Sporormia fimetaria CBS 119925]